MPAADKYLTIVSVQDQCRAADLGLNWNRECDPKVNGLDTEPVYAVWKGLGPYATGATLDEAIEQWKQGVRI